MSYQQYVQTLLELFLYMGALLGAQTYLKIRRVHHSNPFYLNQYCFETAYSSYIVIYVTTESSGPVNLVKYIIYLTIFIFVCVKTLIVPMTDDQKLIQQNNERNIPMDYEFYRRRKRIEFGKRVLYYLPILFSIIPLSVLQYAKFYFYLAQIVLLPLHFFMNQVKFNSPKFAFHDLFLQSIPVLPFMWHLLFFPGNSYLIKTFLDFFLNGIDVYGFTFHGQFACSGIGFGYQYPE